MTDMLKLFSVKIREREEKEREERDRFLQNMPEMLDFMQKRTRTIEFDGSPAFFDKIIKVSSLKEFRIPDSCRIRNCMALAWKQFPVN